MPHIISTTRFAAPKAPELLVHAVNKLGRPFRLTFIGDGPKLSMVQGLVCELGLDDYVTFCGVRSDVAELLATGHIFALSTHAESFGISALEAMRAGLPVVATKVGGLKEVVQNGQTGYLVEAGNIDAMSEALSALVEDPTLRLRLGNAGLNRYRTNFSLQSMADTTASVYDTVDGA